MRGERQRERETDHERAHKFFVLRTHVVGGMGEKSHILINQ